MKTIIITAAAALFAANVGAADSYSNLVSGNPDSSAQRVTGSEDFAGVQPSIGDNVDRYQGFADGNTDLFEGDGRQERMSTGRPDIYINVSGNPDLRF
jgi:hypothetical protein